jgi:hypothetical protein
MKRVQHNRLQHWESWLLRAVLLATAVVQVVTGNANGALVAAEGVVVSLASLAVDHFSKTHLPRALEFVFVLTIALQFVSESTKLFELLYYWDKLVHPVEIALSSVIAAWLLLGFRDARDIRLPDHLIATMSMLVGAALGLLWEFVEFLADWFTDANLQKSTGDSVTDLISNDIGSVIATLVAMGVYKRWIGRNQRLEMGAIAVWLTGWARPLLDRHGRLIGAAAMVLVTGLLAGMIWVDRGTPALAAGSPPGGDMHWSFAAGTSSGEVLPLLGDWVPDERGICRVNLDNPKPGSEKMGLLALAPDTLVGADGQAFAVRATYFLERPGPGTGSQMDAGVVFGLRDPGNFYVLQASALHDIVRLDRYVNGRRRDLREKLYRTRGNEWHTLEVDVRGDQATARIDDQELFTTRVQDADGDVGLWARTSAATCFGEAEVRPRGR